MRPHNMLVFASARPPEITGLDADHEWKWETRALAGDFRKFECKSEGGNTTITIFDSIGDDGMGGGVTPTRIAAALRSVGKQPITVEINSPGGNYFDGVAIYNLLRRHEAEVTVQVLGIAASAASIIAMAGDRIEIAKNAEIMIHRARGLFFGTEEEVAAAATTLRKIDDAMADTYAARTGIDRNELLAMMRAETFIGGEEAVSKKFADALMERAAEPLVYADAAENLPHDPETLDKFLAKQGMPRSERRKLYKAMKSGTPSAAEPATPSAGPAEADIARLIRTLTTN